MFDFQSIGSIFYKHSQSILIWWWSYAAMHVSWSRMARLGQLMQTHGGETTLFMWNGNLTMVRPWISLTSRNATNFALPEFIGIVTDTGIWTTPVERVRNSDRSTHVIYLPTLTVKMNQMQIKNHKYTRHGTYMGPWFIKQDVFHKFGITGPQWLWGIWLPVVHGRFDGTPQRNARPTDREDLLMVDAWAL